MGIDRDGRLAWIRDPESGSWIVDWLAGIGAGGADGRHSRASRSVCVAIAVHGGTSTLRRIENCILPCRTKSTKRAQSRERRARCGIAAGNPSGCATNESRRPDEWSLYESNYGWKRRGLQSSEAKQREAERNQRIFELNDVFGMTVFYE